MTERRKRSYINEIKNYLKPTCLKRVPYCNFDNLLYDEKHCQKCPHYFGSLSMNCSKVYMKLVE